MVFQFNTQVDYEKAGVRFKIALDQAAGESAATLKVTAEELATRRPLAMNHATAPAVHDFTRGYARWLGSKGIRAEKTDEAVTGVTTRPVTSVDLLQIAHDAVDMIDQRFPNYEASVIGSGAYSDIVYKKSDGVAWLTLNRPETYNAKRGITMDEMAHALLDAAGDSSVRVVVISGAGPNGFCTGNDQSYDPSLERSDYSGSSSVSYSQVVRNMPQPVICAVDGFAIGSGNILAYESDFTIATTRSRFGQTGPRVGSPAAGHGVAMLAARVGQKRAREIWMLCQQYSAQEAFEMGLVNKVVPPEQLWDEVNRWIGYVKGVSPVIVQMQKISFRQYEDFENPDVGPVQQYIPDYSSSAEGQERRLAFVERRPLDHSKNMPFIPVPIV
ncbi:MAG: hypothetical protein EXR66_08595 [Dehalococcoidia bacterium]|nr:hypothetical protein [Dehalococcoidia bacterium]